MCKVCIYVINYFFFTSEGFNSIPCNKYHVKTMLNHAKVVTSFLIGWFLFAKINFINDGFPIFTFLPLTNHILTCI